MRPTLHYRLHGRDLSGSDTGTAIEEHALILLVSGKDTVVQTNPAGEPVTASIPTLGFLRGSTEDGVFTAAERWHEIARWNGRRVLTAAVTDDSLNLAASSGRLERHTFRDLHAVLGDAEQALLSRAIQILGWFHSSRYCPVCGAGTRVAGTEVVARCPQCGYDQYPRLSPAMIVAVVRDRKILLASSPRFRGAFHSVLAGFVEPGETVEECIHREVCEEVGITVRDVRYLGSQSWPFPHSLMLAFTAEWASGEIRIDEDEIVHADWYGPDELPEVPPELSIAGRMIAQFRSGSGKIDSLPTVPQRAR